MSTSTPATASPAGDLEVTHTADGSPRLTTADALYAAPGKLAWKVCAPDCGPVVSSKDEYEPGPTAAGTTFELTRTVDGRTTVSRSPVWQGQVAQLTPPSITGSAVPGGTVTATVGTWSGGWPTDRSELELRACPKPSPLTKRDEEDCVAMNERAADRPGSVSITLGAAYTGRYVGAVEAREDAARFEPSFDFGPFDPAFASGSPSLSTARFIAASPLVGPIPAPTAAQEPTMRWAKRLTRRKGKLTLGTMTCPIRCGFTVSVVGLKRGGVITTQVSGSGTFALRVPAKGLKKPRRAYVIVSGEGFRFDEAKLLRVR